MFLAAAVLVVGSTGAAEAVPSGSGGDTAQAGASESGGVVVPDAGRAATSGFRVTAGKRARAKRKALKRCRSKNSRNRRRSCVRRVKRKYATPKPARPAGETFTIDVRDKYFSPDAVEIKLGDSLLWYWNPVNHDAHNVNLVSGPRGVDRLEFGTPSSPSIGFRFKRTFTVPGTYHFACSIHKLMTMTVEVSR